MAYRGPISASGGLILAHGKPYLGFLLAPSGPMTLRVTFFLAHSETPVTIVENYLHEKRHGFFSRILRVNVKPRFLNFADEQVAAKWEFVAC